jgi:hypothetical protein
MEHSAIRRIPAQQSRAPRKGVQVAQATLLRPGRSPGAVRLTLPDARFPSDSLKYSGGRQALIMKKSDSRKVESASSQSASQLPASRLIDARIQELADWRGEMLARLRALIHQADPEVVEEWKWEIPVWSHNGILCTGETYKKVVKMTFAKGASLDDPSGLFNSSLEGKVRRAIDFREGDKVNEKNLKILIQAAAALNTFNI